MACVGVVGGAGALRGDHRGAERLLGRAASAERGTLVRLPAAAQHLAGDANFAFRGGLASLREADRGVEVRIGGREAETASRDDPEPAPRTIDDDEDDVSSKLHGVTFGKGMGAKGTVEEEGFECPTCGATVDEDDKVCPNCEEEFV